MDECGDGLCPGDSQGGKTKYGPLELLKTHDVLTLHHLELFQPWNDEQVPYREEEWKSITTKAIGGDRRLAHHLREVVRVIKLDETRHVRLESLYHEGT